MASLFTSGKFQAFDASGNPLSGGKVYTYAAGTTTQLATYTTQAGSVENANPVILNSAGQASIWLGSSAYKFVVTDADDVAAPDGTTDNVLGAAAASDITGLALAKRIVAQAHGATGNGSTDDTSAMAAAFAALAGGKTLYLTAGTYIISSDLPALPAGASIVAEPGAWLKRASGAANTVFITTSSDNVIDGLNIDGNAYPTSGGIPGTWLAAPFAVYAPSSAGSSNVIIKNCHFKDIDFGIFAQDISFWRITNNLIERTQGSGILIGATATGSVVHNIVSGNQFREHGDTAAAFYQVASGGVIKYNSITNNTAKNTQYRTNGYAFDFEAAVSAGMYGNSIIGNTVEQTASTGYTQGGVTIGWLNDSSTISGNTLIGNLHNDGDVGANAPKSINVLVSGNTISGFRGAAINVDGSTGALVSGNTIKDSGSTSSTYAAIRAARDYATPSVSIIGNSLSWSGSYAYAGAGSCAIGAIAGAGLVCANLTISGNTIIGPIDLGIAVNGESGSNYYSKVSITGNTITGNGTLFTRAPIQATYCDALTVASNTITDTKRGFDLTNSKRGRVSGNTIRNIIADTLPSFVDITGVTETTIDGNDFKAAVTTPISPLATLTTGANNNKARNNRGAETSASGVTSAIATGATVTHGLIGTPTVIHLSAGDSGSSAIYPSSIGATTFAINYTGGGTHVFHWRAEMV